MPHVCLILVLLYVCHELLFRVLMIGLSLFIMLGAVIYAQSDQAADFYTDGIDRRDVRIVCHFNVPKSMEYFYQESGRASRDRLPSQSLLYYGVDDHKRMEFVLSNAGNKKLQSPTSNSQE